MGDIFDSFPSSKSQGGQRATNGGKMPVSPIPYATPVGPKGLGNSGPGLGGDNYGCGQRPGCNAGTSGSPASGRNRGNSPTQRG